MKLIYNWRKAYKMLSVQAMTVAGAIQGAWACIPEDMKVHIPSGWVTALTIGLLAFGIVGRLLAQPAITDAP